MQESLICSAARGCTQPVKRVYYFQEGFTYSCKNHSYSMNSDEVVKVDTQPDLTLREEYKKMYKDIFRQCVESTHILHSKNSEKLILDLRQEPHRMEQNSLDQLRRLSSDKEYEMENELKEYLKKKNAAKLVEENPSRFLPYELISLVEYADRATDLKLHDLAENLYTIGSKIAQAELPRENLSPLCRLKVGHIYFLKGWLAKAIEISLEAFSLARKTFGRYHRLLHRYIEKIDMLLSFK